MTTEVSGNKNLFFFAVLLPIVGLLALTFFKQSIVSTGRVLTFEISGYDPRDLLSGHYLRFRVNYQAVNQCNFAATEQIYFCNSTKEFIYENSVACQGAIAGFCQDGNFVAGIERFYIPQENASDLEMKIRDKKATITVAVSSQGTAIIKQLLIDGEAWNVKSE